MIQHLTKLVRPLARASALAALSAVVLLFPAAPRAEAQCAPVAVGNGTYQSPSTPDVVHFTFVVKETSNGSTSGLAIWQGPTGGNVWRVTSSMHIGETTLFAGEVIWTWGVNPPGIAVGGTVFSAVNDNGPGSADQITGLGVVPPQFGNLTIQQIVVILGGGPPPAAFQSLLSGNIWTP